MRTARGCLLVIAIAALIVPAAVAKIPRAFDYHSLLVSSDNPKELLLGTHNGMFRSLDGGRTWKAAGLAGRDVMNLAQDGPVIWATGHEVFTASDDGGRTWQNLTPKGLPTLDVHGFAVSAGGGRTLYAEIAGRGVYTSRDNGKSFQRLAADPAGAGMVMALTVALNGSIFAGDMQQGIYVHTGHGWTRTATGMAMALSVDPNDARRVIATTRGIALSTDSGRTWSAALKSKVMFGPIAWSPTDPGVAYAVGYDRSLWRTTDAGKSWSRIG